MGRRLNGSEMRYWRTDIQLGRNIYAVLSNDPAVPSASDPLIGVMETSALAEDVVNSHNALLAKYGRRYPKTVLNLK